MEEAIELDPGLAQALLGEDDLGVVVRSHILVEANLNQLLELVVGDPSHLPDLGLSYGQKVLLASALGFDSQFKDALLALGAVRDAFSRKLDTQLTPQIVSLLLEKLPPFGRTSVEKSHMQVRSQCASLGDKSFEELSPKDQFVMIALNLERVVRATVLLIKTSHRRARSST